MTININLEDEKVLDRFIHQLDEATVKEDESFDLVNFINRFKKEQKDGE